MNHNLLPAFFCMLELEENDVRADQKQSVYEKENVALQTIKICNFWLEQDTNIKWKYETFFNKRLKLLKISPYG